MSAHSKWIEEETQKADKEYKKTDEKEGRRFDLLCIRNDQLIVVLELMRPGEPADYDHVMRLNRYVTRIQSALQNSGTTREYRGKSVSGMLIADDLADDPSLNNTLVSLRHVLDAITWNGLLKLVMGRYRDFFDFLKLRAPDDPRLKGLVKPAK